MGQEPVVAYLAARGCSIVATDLGSGAWWGNWKEILNDRNLCNQKDFEKRVQARDVDMNWIPLDLRKEEFDFAWSCCSLDHVGSILLGQRFICKQMECLASGGVSIHTGEYNLTSTWDTVDYASTVAWTRYDICMLMSFLESHGNKCHFDWQFDPESTYPRLKDMGVSMRGNLDLTSFALPVVKGEGQKVIWAD